MQAQGTQAGGAARNGDAHGFAITNTKAAAKPQLEPEENYWGVSRLPQCLSSQTEHRPSTGETGTTPVLPTHHQHQLGSLLVRGSCWHLSCLAPFPEPSVTSPAAPATPVCSCSRPAPAPQGPGPLLTSPHNGTSSAAITQLPPPDPGGYHGCHLPLSTPFCQPCGNPQRAQRPQPPLTHAILLLDGQPGRHGHRATRAVPWGPGRCRATAGSSCHPPRVTCTLSL